MELKSIVANVSLVVGLLMIACSLYLFKETQVFVAQSIIAKGIVVRLEAVKETVKQGSSPSQTRVSYKPVAQFKTQEGKVVEFTSLVASAPSQYLVGEKLDVRYAATDPLKAEINDIFSLWGMPTLLAALGIISLVFPLVVRLKLKSS
jgi:hypothetical protein